MAARARAILFDSFPGNGTLFHEYTALTFHFAEILIRPPEVVYRKLWGETHFWRTIFTRNHSNSSQKSRDLAAMEKHIFNAHPSQHKIFFPLGVLLLLLFLDSAPVVVFGCTHTHTATSAQTYVSWCTGTSHQHRGTHVNRAPCWPGKASRVRVYGFSHKH